MAFKNDVADDMAPVGHLVWPVGPPVCPRLASRLAANHCKTIAEPLQNRCKTKRGQTGGQRGPLVWLRLAPRLATNYCKTLAKAVQTQLGASRGARRGQMGAPTGAKWGARWARWARRGARRGPYGGPDGAIRGGGRKDYLLLKEKMTCSVYVSCKSSLASDVSDVG
jgi:hypothetical protein